MQIRDYRVFVVGNPPPHFGGRYFIFLKLVTDNGIAGYGEAYGIPFHPHTAAAMLGDVVERQVLGHNPFQIEALWRRVYSSNYTQRPGPALMGVLSAIEIACWDIAGKALDRPIYDLLGGRVHQRLRSYTYLYPEPDDTGDVYTDPALAAQRAAAYLREGFTALKFDPLGPYSAFDPRQPSLEAIARSVAYVAAVREAVGSRADLLFGTHGQMTPSGAIRLARQLEPFDPLWLEEPVPPENPAAMAQVAAATTIPIATGERLTTKYEFASVLRHGAASILQMALGQVGGILEARKIAGMAEAFYAQIAPHLYTGPIAGAAAVQLATCTPNFLIQESIRRWDGFHADLLETPVVWQDGYIVPPTAPGLGVALNEAVAEAHPYTGDGLHLSPADEPIID